MKLTEKQKRFADYYIETGNATQSYIDAGYKATSRQVAEANARKLLANYSVKKLIDERMAEKEDEQIAKQDEVLRYLTKVMRREEKEHQVVTLRRSRSWYEDGKKQTVEEEVSEIVEIPSKLSDANKAAELLGKRYAMWTDKQTVDVQGAVTFVDDIGEEDET
ncbi:terminase small subunit [Mesobacillus zeae]|uniref:Terminase small subunit n=1 Tax=Mesobacillus zeae TaxID=1917180 RepID=A0A398B784_9BACI|nr:terminase small subunit [Mesobacillus zeae]RID85657.1 terminase small subunit [Mesobacillus zeae]